MGTCVWNACVGSPFQEPLLNKRTTKMDTTDSVDEWRKGDIELKQNKQSGMVQMKRDDYQRIKNNFSLLKAKHVELLRKNQTMQNVYSALSEKDEDLKQYKAKAHKYELAYIRAETKLTNLCMQLRQQTGNKSLDISALLRALEEDRSSSMSSGLPVVPKHAEVAPDSSGAVATSGGEKRDIETDGVSSSIPEENKAAQKDSFEAHARKTDSHEERVLSKLVQENMSLKQKIDGFEKHSDAWQKFKAQEEQLQLIEELRLELARVQVQNHELKLLLQAKANNNIDALTAKLNDYMAQGKKLEKQLLSKQAVLNALQKDYRRVKVECEKLSRLQSDRATSSSIDSEDTSSIKDSVDPGYVSNPEITKELSDKVANLQTEKERLEQKVVTLQEIYEKNADETEQLINNLKIENRNLTERIEECQKVIQDLKASRTTLDDQPITMSLLREERDKLRERVGLYEQEQIEEKRNYSILEGQMNIVQTELGSTKLALQNAKAQISQLQSDQTIRVLEEKNVKYREEKDRLQKHIEQLTAMLEANQKQIASLHEELAEQKRQVKELKLTRFPEGSSPKPLHHDPTPQPWMSYQPYGQTVSDFIPKGSIPAPRSLQSDYLAGSQSTSGSFLHEVADGDGDIPGGGVLVCERCLREFESHEEFKYKQHIKKCQD